MTYAQYCRLGVHVSASARTVVRKAHGMLRADVRRGAVYRGARHDWLRAILQEHRDARDVCVQWRF